MKKLLTIVLCLTLAGCAPIAPINGYENGGDKSLEWFVVTREDFINSFNEKLKAGDFSELILDGNFDDQQFRYDDNDKGSWAEFEIWAEKNNGYIRSVEYDIELEDENDAQKAGFYFQSLIETFSPRNYKKVISALRIFSDFPSDAAWVEYQDGNTKYAYSESGVLRIHPIEYEAPKMQPQRPGTN